MEIIKFAIFLVLLGCSSSNSERLLTAANYGAPLAVGLVATKAFGSGN